MIHQYNASSSRACPQLQDHDRAEHARRRRADGDVQRRQLLAAPDGLTLALINPVNAMEPILNPDVAKFDARQFKWLGGINSEVGTCAFWNDRIRSLDDLKGAPVTLGATGPSSGSTLDAKAIQGILGLNFKMVLGYPGLNDVRLAAENKEVDGFCGLQVSSIKATLSGAHRAGKFHVVVQTGLRSIPTFRPQCRACSSSRRTTTRARS